MTKVIYISGVHGAGKTTIINKLAAKIQNAGLSVFTFPEMSYIQENIPIKTIAFQMWFKKQIQVREQAIKGIFNSGVVDYILVDRHSIDIDIYTNHILEKDMQKDLVKQRDQEMILNYDYDFNKLHFIIRSDYQIIKERLQNRSEFYREQWNETEEKYIKDIMKRFDQVEQTFRIPVIENNNKIDKTIDEIMRLIY